MTKDERMQAFEENKSKLESNGYKAKEHTISILMANIYAILIAGPIAVLIVGLFYRLHNITGMTISPVSFLTFYGLMMVTVLIHEFLHGLGWSVSCEKGWKSIHIGVIWKALTPYCSCIEPLSYKQYLLGSIMPLLVLGFGFSIVAFITANQMLLALGAINIVFAGGDITIMLMLLKHRKKTMIDHPTKCGFWSFTKV